MLQDPLITVAKKRPQFRYDPAVDSFKGWLLKTTFNSFSEGGLFATIFAKVIGLLSCYFWI